MWGEGISSPLCGTWTRPRFVCAGANPSALCNSRKIVRARSAHTLPCRILDAHSTYSNNITGFANCTTCGPLKEGPMGSSSEAQCFLCPRGKRGFNDRHSCVDCEAGTYSMNLGSASCSACGKGNYSNSGSKACVPCPTGKYGNAAGSSKRLGQSALGAVVASPGHVHMASREALTISGEASCAHALQR